jgi:hypothetical protein
MAEWRDYAPGIGMGIGAAGIGALMALVGDRKKRIRNALIGSLVGGIGGLAFGNVVRDCSEFSEAYLKKKKEIDTMRPRLSAARDIIDNYDKAARMIGVKVPPIINADGISVITEDKDMQISRDRSDALLRIAEESPVLRINKIMNSENADNAEQAIRIPEDRDTFRQYHNLVKKFGPDGEWAFLPIRRKELMKKPKVYQGH